ncbi:MAG: glycosyltransferase family 9 protein, partial [Pseudomonadota bacterium]
VAAFYLRPFHRKAPHSPKKFLFMELSEMGSAILAYPTMKALKKHYPEAELFFLIFEKNRASVDILKAVPPENVLVISEKSLFSLLADILKVIFRMRREKIDCVFDLELFARVTALLTYLSGAPIRVGFHKFRMEGLYRGNLHTHKVQYNYQQHISKSFLSLVSVLRYPSKDWPAMDEVIPDQEGERASYQMTESGKVHLLDKLKGFFPALGPGHRLIIFNPSAGEIPLRAWPVEKYIELGERILRDPQNVIILMGGRCRLGNHPAGAPGLEPGALYPVHRPDDLSGIDGSIQYLRSFDHQRQRPGPFCLPDGHPEFCLFRAGDPAALWAIRKNDPDPLF